MSPMIDYGKKLCAKCRRDGLRLYCTECFKPDELEEIILLPPEASNEHRKGNV